MKKLILSLALLFTITAVYGQNYEISQDESSITVSGTSNVHDWELNAEDFSGNAAITVEDGELVAVDELQLTVVVNSLKSGKGGLDKKAYGALNEKNHPEINFVLNEVSQIKTDTVIAKGDLTISGQTKAVEMPVSYNVLPDGAVAFSGSKSFNMSEYDVDPPSAMFGAVRSGDEIEVAFDVTWTCPETLACAE